jgi:hypothetical protein
MGGGGAAKRLVWTEPAGRAGKGNGRERKGAVFPRPSAEAKQPFDIRIQSRSSSIRILRATSIVTILLCYELYQYVSSVCL